MSGNCSSVKLSDPGCLEGIMNASRRKFLHLGAGVAMLPAALRSAWAESYPAHPVRIVVGFAAGSTTDILARLMGQWLSQRLGQQFVVENRPGAGGNIGAETVVKAAPGGYMRLMAPPVVAAHATDRVRGARSQRSRGQPVDSGKDHSRIDHVRQGQSRQAQLCLGRDRDREPSGRPIVQYDDRRKPSARALSRRWARHG